MSRSVNRHRLFHVRDLPRSLARQALRPFFRDEDVVLDPDADVPPLRVDALALRWDVNAGLDRENHPGAKRRVRREVARAAVRRIAKLVAAGVVDVEPGIYIRAKSEGVDPKWWNIGVR